MTVRSLNVGWWQVWFFQGQTVFTGEVLMIKMPADMDGKPHRQAGMALGG
jgi:hypothetical protein